MNSHSKRLSALLPDVRAALLWGWGDPEITSVEYDSRSVRRGSLFVAVHGLQLDGARFIRDALARGAVAVAGDTPPPESLTVPFVHVPDARKALAELAWSFHDHPERDLTLVGITGTNGKTTVASVLRTVLEQSGIRTGLVGTLGVHYGDTSGESARTTPESADLARHFAAMREQGFRCVVMEATSIGIDLQRTWGLPFRVTVFTNLTRDHLDYHGSEDAYLAAKLRLFREQPAGGVSVVNLDDPHAGDFVQAATGTLTGYAVERDADFRAVNVELSRQGIRFDVMVRGERTPMETPLIGHFNVYNLLAVIAAADALGIPLSSVQHALRTAQPARGRAETVPGRAPFTIIVDYAHTPDALEKILTTLRELKPKRILTVVGAGGDRDRGKRPLMAEVSYRLSDRLYLTSDNPRSEDAERILDDMESGTPKGSAFVRNADRRAAIEHALSDAQDGDIVLIAGKGHETYQEIRGERFPFDDRQVAMEWLERAGYGA